METSIKTQQTIENTNKKINKFKSFLSNYIFVKLIDLIKVEHKSLEQFQYDIGNYGQIETLKDNNSFKDLIRTMDSEYEELIESIVTKDRYIFDKYLLSDVQTDKQNKTYISDIFEDLLTIYDNFENDYLKLYFDEEGHLHFEMTEAVHELYEDIDKYRNFLLYPSRSEIMSLFGLNKSIFTDIDKMINENLYYMRVNVDDTVKEHSLIQKFENEDGHSYLNENYRYIYHESNFEFLDNNRFHIVFNNPINIIENAFFVPENNYGYLKLLLSAWETFFRSILDIINKVNVLDKLMPYVTEHLKTFFDRIDYDLNDTIHEYYCRLDKQDLMNNLVSNIEVGIKEDPYKRFFLPLEESNGFVFENKVMYSYLKDEKVVVANPLFHEHMTDYRFLKPVEVTKNRYYEDKYRVVINNETVPVSIFVPDNHLDILKEKGLYVEEIEHYLEHEETILIDINVLKISVAERYKEYATMYYQKVQFIHLNDRIVKISTSQDDKGNDILKYSHMANYRLGTSYVLNTKPEYIEVEELIKLYLNKEIPKESKNIVAKYIVTSAQKMHEQVMNGKLKDIVDKIDETYYVYMHDELLLLIIDNQVYNLMLTSQSGRLRHIQNILNHTFNKSIQSVKVYHDVMTETPRVIEQQL